MRCFTGLVRLFATPFPGRFPFAEAEWLYRQDKIGWNRLPSKAIAYFAISPECVCKPHNRSTQLATYGERSISFGGDRFPGDGEVIYA
ncbi:hypothetical protein [Aerosakkonema funiforme]|uniref:hypothetical protein n=1 Tax=Aerosakkonema funiforme TaxID=1246630 RepID=UPI0035B7B73F